MNWEGQVYGFANSNAQPPTPIPTPTSATGPGFSITPLLSESPEATEFGSQTKWDSPHHQEYLRTFFQSPVQQQQSFQQSLAPSSDSSHRPLSSAGHKRHLSDPENRSKGLASSTQQRPRFSNLPEPSPIKPPNRLSSPSTLSPTKRSRQLTPATFGTYLGADQTVNSARSIQTPPPSRTMSERSARRKASKTRLQTTKSASGTGHEYKRNPPLDTSPLDGYGSIQHESRDLHQAFQNSQVSSNVLDLYGYPLSAPASAPAFPHKLFWDPSSEVNGIGVSFDAGQHNLVNQNVQVSNQNMDWGVSGQNTRLSDQTGVSAVSFGSVPDSHISQSLVSQPDSFSAFEFSQAPFPQTSPDSYTYIPAISDGAVNPNLIFSFSTQPGSSYRAEHSEPEVSRMQPYQHQTQELERERELENTRKTRQQKSANTHGRSSTSSLNPYADLASLNPYAERTQHPNLKRSVSENVISTLNRAMLSGQSSAANALGIINDENIAPERRNSPLKRAVQQATLSSIPEKKSQPRTVVSFTIDDKGRAKAETKLVVEESEWETDVGPGIGYGEVDTESDTSTDSDIPDIISRKPSFTFPVGRSERPKLARFDTAPLGRPSGYSNSTTLVSSESRSENRSVNDPLEFSPRLPSPSKGALSFASGPNKGRAISFMGQSGSSFESSKLHKTGSSALQSLQDKETASEAETVLEADEEFDDGTAQHAIKQLIRIKRQKRAEEVASNPPPNKKVLKARQMYSSPRTILRHQETPSSQQQANIAYGDGLDISPTTVTDPDVTPRTDLGSRDTADTRCICRNTDFEGLMILW
ncbi:MAG: hypothetical protein M1839_007314 [Geoglossum umbratile]|nr:MAG: hypothetical protein M1839_007314 [Geoglossum umbratile]